MTDEQLISKVKREYPIGTKFYAAHSHGTICEVFDHNTITIQPTVKGRSSSGDIDLYSQDTRNGHTFFGCVYRAQSDKWAEIISLPDVKPKPVDNYEIY